MAKFYYRALNKNQQVLEGLIEAVDEDKAADILIDKGLVILGLKRKHEGGISALGIFHHVPLKRIVIFSRQLSIMISANIPLVQSLKTLLRQTRNRKMRMVISEIASDVEGGMKFSQALSKHPHAFSNFFVNIVRSGETSGKLDEVLSYMADQMEKDYDFISRVRGAMVYPIFIMIGLIVVGILMMVFVVPKLTSILVEAGVDLPLSTKILIASSNFLKSFWWLLLIGFGIAIFAVRMLIAVPKGKYLWDLVKLRIPLFGGFFQKIAIVRFSQSLHTLISGGVALPAALEITSDVVGNEVYRRLILKTMQEIEGGNSIASVFVQSRDVPFMVSQMLNVGEKAGRLDLILEKIASFYTREIDNLLKNLVTLIEPMVMVVMGVAVGMMVSAVILPVYNLSSSIK